MNKSRIFLKKYWRFALGIAIVIFALVSLYLGATAEEPGALGSNLALFSLVNFTVILLLVLMFLVGRNVVKLIFERRRGILGSKLRSRLVGAFVLVSFIPAIVSYIAASGLLSRAIEGWLSGQVESAVNSSVRIARHYTINLKNSGRLAIKRIAEDPKLKQNSSSDLAQVLEEIRKANGLFAVRLLAADNNVMVEAQNAAGEVAPFREPPPDSEAIEEARNGQIATRVEERGGSQFVRTYGLVGDTVIQISTRVDPEILQAQGSVQDSFKEYEQMKTYKNPLKTSYFLLLSLVHLLTLFGAIWVAFFIARQLTGPIQRLAEGTQAVARGEYDFTIPKVRDDEMGSLVQSFNSMLGDLKLSKATAERRGELIETILRNLAVGVITLDGKRRVTAVNAAAARLCSLHQTTPNFPTEMSNVLPKSIIEQITPLLDAISIQSSEEQKGSIERELTLDLGERQALVLCTVGRIKDLSFGSVQVVILDDITEISKAQHHAAWRDVARRIAHEIKNPLTPIQLSAQRLERLLDASDISNSVKELTHTIVEHVDIIKRLANEFSSYGRMPSAEFAAFDINALISATVSVFAGNHPEFVFQAIVEPNVKNVTWDKEQIRGVLINLLNNAVNAIEAQPSFERQGESGRIVVKCAQDKRPGMAVIEVYDNGPGVPAADKSRVFEPYFTTKKGGTGLGLAIVSSIVHEHQGELAVYDNSPRGARFVIKIPEQPQPVTQRKLAGA